jgi:iron complex outermembrane recepter protein
MRIAKGRWAAGLATAGVCVVAAVPAPAQTSDLEEIVVTARKRDESLQNVPITVSVFTTQEIQSAGIESPRDFIAMVPNMTLVETQNVGNSFISIRGISQARNSEPSVAVLVDGVLETNPYEFNQELFDVFTAAMRSAARSSSPQRIPAISSKAVPESGWATGSPRRRRWR